MSISERVSYIVQRLSRPGIEDSEEEEEFRPITEIVEIDNIDSDIHFHGSFSDAVYPTRKGVELSRDLGLEEAGVADHHRDDLDDVFLYNDGAYRIVDLSEEEGNLLSENMGVREHVLQELKEDLGNEEDFREEQLREALIAKAKERQEEFDEQDIHILGQQTESFQVLRGIERDYESWNDAATEEFLGDNQFDYVVLSPHYVPERFINLDEFTDEELEGLKRDKGGPTQYLRKADFSHLDDPGEVVDWYSNEYKLTLLRSADLTSMDEKKLEKLYSEYDIDTREIEDVRRPIAGDTPVIHPHWDLILTNPDLRPYVTQEHVDEVLDLAEEIEEPIEINGRVIKKLRQEFASEPEVYTDQAEWFAREVLERVEDGELKCTVASDAHSEMEMIEQLAMVDSVLEDYNVEPLTYKEL